MHDKIMSGGEDFVCEGKAYRRMGVGGSTPLLSLSLVIPLQPVQLKILL